MSANSTGSGFEICIEALLKMKYKKVERQWRSGWDGLFGQAIKCDFCCDDSYVVEVKFQCVSDNVEQKLVYAIQQIKECHKLPTTLLLGGTGYSKGCLKWVMGQSGGNLIQIQTTDQFIAQMVKGKGNG